MNPTQNPSAIRSKNEITNTLLHLMKSLPYNEITVKQILIDAHVARKTFYRNFTSKDDVLDIIFGVCMQNQDLLFLLRDNNLLHLILNKLNLFIPMMHNQAVNPEHPFFQPFTSEQVEYIIAFNVGSAWNVILKWIERDMSDAPEYIKKTILHYLDHMSQFT